MYKYVNLCIRISTYVYAHICESMSIYRYIHTDRYMYERLLRLSRAPSSRMPAPAASASRPPLSGCKGAEEEPGPEGGLPPKKASGRE